MRRSPTCSTWAVMQLRQPKEEQSLEIDVKEALAELLRVEVGGLLIRKPIGATAICAPQRSSRGSPFSVGEGQHNADPG